MAIYTLIGTDKENGVQGRYASVKNNGAETIYASSAPDLELNAAEVVPIQPGESVIVRDCRKKLYVRGSGEIAVVSGNEPVNFFNPTPKGESGGGDTVTQQQLNDTLKSYATNTSVDTKLEGYAEKDEIPATLPADGGNADTVGGKSVYELEQDNPNLLYNGNFRLNNSGKTSLSISGDGTMYKGITTVNGWQIGANAANETVTASIGQTGLTVNSNTTRGVYQPFSADIVNCLKNLYSKTVGKISVTIKVNAITGTWGLSQLNGIHNPSEIISTVGIHTVTMDWGGDAPYDYQGINLFNRSSSESSITVEWIKAFPVDAYVPDPNIEKLRTYGYAAFSNQNLLDNPDFKINQRGKAKYDTRGYCVSRWRLYSLAALSTVGTATPTDDGIKVVSGGTAFDAYLIQYIEDTSQFNGKTVTLSAEFAEVNGSVMMGQYGTEGASTHRYDIAQSYSESWRQKITA